MSELSSSLCETVKAASNWKSTGSDFVYKYEQLTDIENFRCHHCVFKVTDIAKNLFKLFNSKSNSCIEPQKGATVNMQPIFS